MTTLSHVVVLDFEATCRPGTPPEPQEIIEFPSVLVSLRERRVVDAFETFVRPTHHPVLDPFCTELTSIRQEDVATAPTFVEAYAAHRVWLVRHGLLGEDGADDGGLVFVTCGDWDLATMLPAQCAASSVALPSLPRAYRRWCNVKKVFGAAFGREKGFGMPTMLADLGLELVGRHHRGIDDCHNIARIVLALAARGATFEPTGRVAASRYPPLGVTLRWEGNIASGILDKRRLPSLLGLASGLFRTTIATIRTLDGVLLTEEALLDFGAHAELLVEGPAPTEPR